ncbi:hypothetical protein P4H46_14645 [Paenibacillus glucanolyticus]|uniref:hypothetical protein n=1 Tax=Paenibacillus glucanolyticus TaxID=59843 RepID=UPI0030C96B98
MFKQLILVTTVITLISGVVLTANLQESDLSNDGASLNPKLSATEESSPKPDNVVQLGPDTYLLEESVLDIKYRQHGTEMIVTKFGDFDRAGKQTIFNESEIAREPEEIGYNTNQLIYDYGIFIRKGHPSDT